MHYTQRAVWRKRGSGSPESLCEFGSFAPVQTAVEAPPAPSRWDVRRHPDSVSVKLTEYQEKKGNFRKTKKGLNSIKKKNSF
ncbi:MAG: hypothetical protein FWF65_09295 [Bacteroidetes bacterium]|nr:hypothetical protein [Bacteroidota bacterium]